MTLQPKKKMKKPLAYFQKSGLSRSHYALILAAYEDQTETALKLIADDPEQINRQDPYAGLTALHIAIFRQNEDLVKALTRHPQTSAQLKDVFGRRAVDMLNYTINQAIFEAVITATYPEEMRALEDEAYEHGRRQGTVVPLRPKEP